MFRFYTCFILFFAAISISYSQNGIKLFRQHCGMCHHIGKGRMVGPDLLGIHDRRDSEWLVKFIRSSQAMIKAGDTAALNSYNNYNRVIMPDQNLTDEQIFAILSYIKKAGEKPLAVKKDKNSKQPEYGLIKKDVKIYQSPERSHEERKGRITESFKKVAVICLFVTAILFAGLALLILKQK